MKKNIYILILTFVSLIMVAFLIKTNTKIEKTPKDFQFIEDLEKAQARPKYKIPEGELNLLQKRTEQITNSNNTSIINFMDGSSSFANGALTGTWSNVETLATPGRWTAYGYRADNSVYDKANDILYPVSYAGHLYRIDKDETNIQNTLWTPLNIKRDFSDENFFFQGLNYNGNAFRLLWCNGNQLKYSNDEGKTWATSGITSFSSNTTYGAISNANGVNNVVVVGSKSGNYRPYYSQDDGLTYTLSSFSITTTNNDMRVVQPHFTDDIYLFVRNSSSKRITIYKWNYSTNTFDVNQSPTHTFVSLKNVFGTFLNGTLHMYVVNSSSVYYSNDAGATWTTTNNAGNTKGTPRAMHPTKPEILFAGTTDYAISTNFGASFSNTGNILGWDIHNIRAYQKNNGNYFLFVGDDFGSFMSYTPEDKNSFIFLNNKSSTMMCYDADNSQHYNYNYAATQDRGTFGVKNQSEPVYTKQLRSTDGLRVTLSQNEKGAWTWMYFGTIYHQENFGIKSSDLKSNNFSNSKWWASAMVASPNLSEDAVYIASSTKLKKLTFDKYANKIIKTDHHFNFSSLTAATLSGFGYSPIDNNKWYVSAKNGDIFYSEDGGHSFAKSTVSSNTPKANTSSSNYKKNQHVIKGSRIDVNTVFYAGVTHNNSYSGNKFMISKDGGKTFTNHSAGLNAWRIRSFDMSPDEKYIYAACATAGIWVYVVDEDSWYEMNDENVPEVDFTNVEYIVRDDVVRFSSYGNGILNFSLDNKLRDIAYPSNLQIVSESNPSIELNWIDNSNNETGFYVQKTRNDIDWETIATLGANTTEFIDNETSGTDYITYRIVAFNNLEESNPSNYVVSFSRNTLPDKTGWELLSTDSHRSGLEGHYAFDGDIDTYWMTEWNNAPVHPHEIVIDMHETINIKALGWYNRQDHPNGRVAQYEFYASTDLNNWGSPVSQGTWTGTTDQIIESFPEVTARYLKFIALSSTNEGTNNNLTSCAEISVYKEVPAPEAPKTPYKPEIITAFGTGDNSAEIQFIDASNNENGFYVEQFINGSFERIQTLGANTSVAIISNLSSGTYYTYRLSSFNDVGQSEYSNLITVLTTGTSLSTEDFDEEVLNNISAYPNPFVDKITLDFKNYKEIKDISIYTLSGKKIFQESINSNINKHTIYLKSKIASGMYIVKINGNGKPISKKVFKKN